VVSPDRHRGARPVTIPGSKLWDLAGGVASTILRMKVVVAVEHHMSKEQN